MTRRRARLADVADRAGVSRATVSAVVNGTGTVRSATRERVLRAIEELNYRPSGASRGGWDGSTRTLGLVVKEIDNPYYLEMIGSAQARASARGYALVVVDSHGRYEEERRAVEKLRATEVDGILITPVLDENTDLSHLFELKRRSVPFVLLEEIRGLQASLVDVDNVAALRRATEYLIGAGHSRIVHLAGPGYSMHSEQRVQGVRQAYSESHLVFTRDVVVPAGPRSEDGYRAGLRAFGDRPGAERPTAATCYNDLVAIGLLRALRELGIRVPDDVSVIGCDDIGLVEYLETPLSTVRIPKREMAEVAVDLVVAQIESGEAGAPRKTFLPSELILRASTAPRG